jgi:hypothetical protein
MLIRAAIFMLIHAATFMLIHAAIFMLIHAAIFMLIHAAIFMLIHPCDRCMARASGCGRMAPPTSGSGLMEYAVEKAHT